MGRLGPYFYFLSRELARKIRNDASRELMDLSGFIDAERNASSGKTNDTVLLLGKDFRNSMRLQFLQDALFLPSCYIVFLKFHENIIRCSELRSESIGYTT